MLNVAMLSRWHVHADGYADTLLSTGKVKITAVWDDDEARGKPWAEKLGAAFSTNLDEILARPDVDAVVCDAPTSQHEEVMIKAANAKKHIFTEKAMATTVEGAEKIKKAVEDNGVTFVISLPQRCSSIIQFARKAIADGVFGKISLIRIRNGHNGVSGNWLPEYWFDEATAGGGSLMDLGCHPMYTACYLLGAPKKITSIMTSPFGTKVDEHATASIEFEGGAVATCETSFITYNTPGAVEIYGSDATLYEFAGNVKFISKDTDKFAEGYIVPKLPKALPMPLLQFVDACINKTGTPEGFGPKDGVDLTRLLENSYVSYKNNKIVTF